MLAAQLPRALAATSSVSAAKPDQGLTGPLGRAQRGEDVGGGLEDDLGRPGVLLDLALGRRPWAGSRPRRRPSRPRRPGRRGPSTASAISAAVSTATTSTPAGAGRSTVVTSVTLAPRGDGLGGDGVALLARRAVGDDPHGVDGLAGAARGDQHAQAGEVGRCRAPARRRPRCRSGSARRPAPTSPPASRPDSGSTTMTPRRRRVARFSCTAGCSHISVCMAGQTSTGARVASSVAVSRSSEMPAA